MAVKKKGQMDIPFVMIFALIVGALVLVGGVYYIYRLIGTAEQISIGKEINDFKATVKAYYYLEEGNSKQVKVVMPSKARTVCFYQSPGWSPGTSGLGAKYPPDWAAEKDSFYKRYFQSFSEKNMFIFPTKDFKESVFLVPYLKLDASAPNPTCVGNGDAVRITSMGGHVALKAE